MRPLRMLRRLGQWAKLGKDHADAAPRTVSRSMTSVLRRCCKGVDLQHHVKLASSNIASHLQVELDDIDAALHAGQYVGVVDLDAVAVQPRSACR